MAHEKDLAEKSLEDHNDVFADIVNVLLFNGKQVISEDDLQPENPYGTYVSEGVLHGTERDVAKIWKNGKIRIAFLGFENQTKPELEIPIRAFSYDGTSYRAQLIRRQDQKHNHKKPDPLYPVVTLVLYFGYRKHWDKPLSLLETMNVPEELKPFVNDYKANMFEIAYLTDEQVKMFKSDFRVVAEFFTQLRKGEGSINADNSVVDHVHDLLQFLSVVTNDQRLENVYTPDMEGRQVTVCELVDKIEENGVEKRNAKVNSLYEELKKKNTPTDEILKAVMQALNESPKTAK